MTWVTSILIINFMLMAVQSAHKKMTTENEKWSQFECGFNSLTPSHLPFSFQFFFIALLFLIFDVEIALMLAYPLEPTSTKSMLFIFIFIIILSLGLIYEWQKSKLKWSKWLESTSLQEDHAYSSSL